MTEALLNAMDPLPPGDAPAVGYVNGASAHARLRLTVAGIEEVARGCRKIELVRPDGETLPPSDPGSHITLHLPNGLQRQYSLIIPDRAPRRYVIGVKRDAASRGGSAYIFEKLRVGDSLEVAPPRNNFPLVEDAARSIFIAGGIGITPIWAMVQRLRALGREWSLHYAVRSRDEAAFAAELAGRDNVDLHCDDERGGLLPVAALTAAAPQDAHLYCCGPAPMLAAFEAAAAGRDPSHLHVEHFTQKYEASVQGGFVVELARTGREVRVAPGQTIIQALREAGIDVATSCEEGICGACETRVLAGEPDHRDSILTEKERAANKSMFVCCSGSKSERLVLDM